MHCGTVCAPGWDLRLSDTMNLWLYGAAALPPIMRGCLAPPCESLTAGGMRAVAPSIAPKRCGARSATARSPPQRVPSLRGRSALITQNFPSPPHSPLPTTLTLFQIDTIISYLYLISIYLSISYFARIASYLLSFTPFRLLPSQAHRTGPTSGRAPLLAAWLSQLDERRAPAIPGVDWSAPAPRSRRTTA